MTEWRSVPDYDGWYEVSSEGEVRSWIGRRAYPGAERRRRKTPYVLKQFTSPTGYLHLRLYLPNGQAGNRNTHELVLLAFVGPPNFVGAEVRHLNGLPGDNRIQNLRWGTKKENEQDKYFHGTRNRPEKREPRWTQLTEDTVREIRRLHNQGGITQRDLAKKFGVTPSNLCRIVNRKSWKNVR